MLETVKKDDLTPTVNKVIALIDHYKLYCKGHTKNYVHNIPIAFDTETTNYVTDTGDKVGWCYCWMFRFGDPSKDDSIALLGRDLDTLHEFLNRLSEGLNLSANPDDDENTLLYIYVQNLGFDIEFIRDRLTIVSELHAEKHQPIFIRDIRGFEFRDSKILAGGLSLKKIGESLNTGFVKMVGDLDYSLLRTPETPLTETEKGYCLGDVDVLASYIQTQIDYFGGVQHIPLTNTGRVRKFAREHIYKGRSYGSYKRYRELMERSKLSYEQYDQCQRAFYGGFTHANIDYVGKTLKNVESYDFTSSYPAVMLSERFPMGSPTEVKEISFDVLKEIINDPNKLSIFDVQLSNVHVKDNIGDVYLSNDPNKVRVVNPIVDNGRIRACDKIALTVTNIDFKIISQCYDYDNIHVSNVLIWDTDYLPTPLIEVILDLYNAKTTLKGVEGKTEEYNVKKGMLNSLYGMCVTRILRDRVKIDGDDWITLSLTEDERVDNIDKNNDSKTRFLYYPWGVFITAYARFNLWTAIKTLGNDYIYADTDSIKVFSGSEKLKQYLQDYQHDLDLKFKWMLDKRRKFKFDDLKPKTKDGIEKPIGVWDFEGKYEFFKTLGAKRYIKSNENGLYPTVAGVTPKNLSKHLIQSCNNDIVACFDAFKDGLHVPQNKTGKLASIYYKDVDLTVTDYLGNTSHVKQKYGVHLTPVDFTLTMSGSFLDLIKQLNEVL